MDDFQVHEKAGQVHEKAGQALENAKTVLDFWFGLSKEQHFAKDDALDAEIATRFKAMRDAVVADRAAGWREHPDTLLAAIILIDQFSRNLYRGSAEAFAGDDIAAGLTITGIEMGWDTQYPPDRRVFFYMPLMHAEDAPLQKLSVEKFAALGIEENTAFARDHRAVFERFGRFPGRNAALGRTNGADEEAWLKENDGGW